MKRFWERLNTKWKIKANIQPNKVYICQNFAFNDKLSTHINVCMRNLLRELDKFWSICYLALIDIVFLRLINRFIYSFINYEGNTLGEVINIYYIVDSIFLC